ncbi:MAG: lipoate--protein ligase family protein [Nitrospirae bacterium YQR-1]
MALDEVLAENVVSGKSPPTLRFYGWLVPSITIGAFQKISDINLPRCHELNIPVVRRPTGGRAILHGKELTYSFASPSKSAGGCAGLPANIPFTDNLLDNYKLISTTFHRAVQDLGIDVNISHRRLHRKSPSYGKPLCFTSTSFSELTVLSGGAYYKVMGAAQKRFDGGFLEQGSVPLLTDMALLQELFTETDGLLPGLNTFKDDITIDSLTTGVIRAFEETFNIVLKEEPLSSEEKKYAELLEKEKYASSDWTLRK